MTQKERIIELVKNNVISMDEALQLLEAAAKNNHQVEVEGNELIEEYQNAQKEIESQITPKQPVEQTVEEKEIANQERIQEKIEIANQELAKKQEALVIAKQRLREIEIFAELDDLTEEMQTQQANLQQKVTSLEAEIEELSIEIDVKRQELRQNTHSQFKKIVEDTTEQVTKAAKNFGEEAKKEGKNLQKTIMGYVKDWASSFDMKEFNVSVPWVKSQSFTHQYQFEATELEKIDIKLLNGSVKVKKHDQAMILVDLDVKLYGKEEENTLAIFESLSSIGVAAETLVLNMMNPRVAAETVVKVPEKVWAEIRIDTINGDIELEGLEVKELKVSSKNGDNEMEVVTADLVTFDGYNGNLIIKTSQIIDLDYHILNGDLRYSGPVGNVKADTINGDIVISKGNEAGSIITAKNLSGDIKIAVPKENNLEIDAESTYGEVHHRLTNINQIEKRFERHIDADKDLTKVTATSTSGDIYLKD